MPAADIQWWQRFGNVAQIASAAIAVIGFGAVLLQLNEIRQNNRATAARQIYLAYADLNFRNPQFSRPDYEKLKAGDVLVFEQYRSFVSYLLYACTVVLHAFPNEPEWRHSCEYEVKDHLPFLCEVQTSDPKYLPTFGQEAIEFVKAAMAREGMISPDCKFKKT